jgi:hypothetical protein
LLLSVLVLVWVDFDSRDQRLLIAQADFSVFVPSTPIAGSQFAD